ACDGSIAEMEARGLEVVPLHTMRRCRADRIDRNTGRRWVKGRNHFAGTGTHAPYELVGLDMRAGSGWDHSSFVMATIGLAAGPNEEHATLHALCELIENDATSMIDVLGIRGSGSREIDCSGSGHAGLTRAI